MNKTKETKRITIFIASILALAMLMSCIGIISGIGQKAQAIVYFDTQSTNLDEMLLTGYADDPTGNVFDGEVFWTLMSQITNGDVTKLSEMSALNSMTKTSADFRSYNDGNDVVVKINGANWIATYLSQNSSGAPILTLWAANTIESSSTNSKWHTSSSSSNATGTIKYPDSMYGTSYMRAVTLNNGGSYAESYDASKLTSVNQDGSSRYAIYTMASAKGSLKSFIEVPNNVSWQRYQYAKNSVTASAYTTDYKYNNNNDALYVGGDGAAGSFLNKTGYKNWGSDSLWLPSVAETGVSDVDGIWQASSNTRFSCNFNNSYQSYYWTRSGSCTSSYHAYLLNKGGNGMSNSWIDNSYMVRPAFHLNLSKAAAKAGYLGLEEPVDVTNPYNGQDQTLADITDETKTSWFDSAKITLTYPSTGMKNAGKYTIKAEIDPDLAEESGLKFSGTPDISDPIHKESETVRYFTYTITKKKIGVVVAKDTNEMPVVSLANLSDVFTGDTEANGRAPTLGFSYSGASLSGSTTTLPTAVGTYTATAIITNDCSYELDDTYSISFKINKKDVTLPAKSGLSTQEYIGDYIEFTLMGGNNSDISFELPDGMSWKDDNRNTNTLIAKNAKQYKVKATLADNGVSTQWPDGSIGAQYFDYEITKKPLIITITCSAAGWEWNVGDTPTIIIDEDSFTTDTTDLYIYYIDSKNPSVKHDGINANKVTVGNTRTITMPGDIAQGSYTIGVELYGSNNDNDNYSLDVPKTAMFTVKGSAVTIDASKIVWMYNNTVITDTSNVKLIYSGNAYQFSVDATVLRTNGAKVDITKGTNGYSGDVNVTNAKSTYSVTVYVTNYDNTYETHNSQYTLNYSIDKAKYDLSGLSWPTTNTTEYKKGIAQSMELSGSLPQGLSVKYTGNDKMPVGPYTTTVTFIVSDTDNYYVPTKGATDTYEGSFDFDFAWAIEQATLDVSWKDDNNGSSDVYKLPTLKSIGDLDVDSMVDYTYYDSSDNVVTTLPTNVTQEMTFKAVATLKTAHAGNYKFKAGTNEYTFTIGKDKYVVTLILKYNGNNIDDAEVAYTGQAVSPTIEITKTDGGIIPANITLKYFKDGSTSYSTDAPTTVGNYRVTAELNYGGDLNYIDNDSAEFEFKIIKADFDVSGLKWTYAHTDKDGNVVNATYDLTQSKWLDASGSEIQPMTYDTTPHTLTLEGKDGIDNLTITVSGNEQTNAGSAYTAQVTYTYDTDNYNAPNFPDSLSWSIAKAKIDASNIVWGYSVGVSADEIAYTDNLPYTRIEGGEVKYTVKLINVPDELKDFIKYTGTTDGTTEVGSYSTTYRIDNFDTNNYETLVMPSGLLTKFNWEVEPKKLDKPVYDGSWTMFDGEVHDFAGMFGITDNDWKLYINMIVTKDGEEYAGLSGDDYDHLTDKQYKAIKAGEYLVKFELIAPTSNSDVTNVLWLDRPDPTGYTVEVEKYKIDVKEWQGSNENATVNLDTWVKAFVSYRITDSKGNTVNSNNMQLGEIYTKELCAKAGYENDIEIIGKKTLSISLGTVKVAKPIFDEEKTITYDGNTHTVEEFLKKPAGKGVKFDVEEMTDAREYTITVSLDGEVYTWEDGSNDSYTYTVKIDKATVSQNTLVWATDANGLPKLTVRGHSDIEFKYTYLDADGFELTLAEIADGMEYAKVIAKIDNGNYDIIDVNKDVVEQVTYDPKAQGNKDPEENKTGGVVDFGKVGEVLKEWWQIIASVISIILIIIFTSKGISYASKKKQAKNTIKNKYNSAYYAGMVGLFGLSMTAWTAIACVLMGLGVLSFVFMLIEKSGYNKAERELENARDEYNANKAEIENKQRADQMQMMLMGMLGNNGGGQGVQSAAIDMGAIQGMIDDAMSRNIQQLPPVQQSSMGDDTIQRLNDTIARLQDQISSNAMVAATVVPSNNDDIIKSLVEGQKMIMQRLSEQQPVEKVIAREVAVGGANDETIKNLVEGQKLIMQRLDEMAKKQDAEPQIVEKIVEKEVKVEVPVEVEKIVEKEIVKEVPVEKVVEKIIEKEVKVEVPIEASAPIKTKKEVAPKLSLDEAYAQLSKQQQKYFDGLRQYALTKDKCKEKKSTYFIVFGQSTVNPLMKLTIKKDTVVALFKMEDEYLKDIKRDATSDGTKVKVKETEVIISDAQACKVAKNMIDLREDQIERYQDLLKEQRAIKSKK
ncbi:MAG: hypothetical protein K2M75_05385 [Clostridia bacterium]|nr:hypothetical protein [Clostridia bacterium]